MQSGLLSATPKSHVYPLSNPTGTGTKIQGAIKEMIGYLMDRLQAGIPNDDDLKKIESTISNLYSQNSFNKIKIKKEIEKLTTENKIEVIKNIAFFICSQTEEYAMLTNPTRECLEYLFPGLLYAPIFVDAFCQGAATYCLNKNLPEVDLTIDLANLMGVSNLDILSIGAKINTDIVNTKKIQE